MREVTANEIPFLRVDPNQDRDKIRIETEHEFWENYNLRHVLIIVNPEHEVYVRDVMRHAALERFEDDIMPNIVKKLNGCASTTLDIWARDDW